MSNPRVVVENPKPIVIKGELKIDFMVFGPPVKPKPKAPPK